MGHRPGVVSGHPQVCVLTLNDRGSHQRALNSVWGGGHDLIHIIKLCM